MQKIAFVASMVIAAQAVGTESAADDTQASCKKDETTKFMSPIDLRWDSKKVPALEEAKKFQLRGSDFGMVRGAYKSFNNEKNENSMPLQGNGFLYIGKMGNNDKVEKHVEVGDKFIPWKMDYVFPAEHLGVCAAEDNCLEIQISFTEKSDVKGNRANNDHAKVMSLFVKTLGKEDENKNAFIETLKVSSKATTEAEKKIEEFDFGAFMNSFDVTDFITYTGSLTQKDCDKNTETNWILVTTPSTMSVNQGDAIAKMWTTPTGLTTKTRVTGNARVPRHEDGAPKIQVHNNKFSSNALAFSAGLSVAATLLFAAF